MVILRSFLLSAAIWPSTISNAHSPNQDIIDTTILGWQSITSIIDLDTTVDASYREWVDKQNRRRLVGEFPIQKKPYNFSSKRVGMDSVVMLSQAKLSFDVVDAVEFELTVEVGEGVTGEPLKSSSHSMGTLVKYSYASESCNTLVIVSVDGLLLPNRGEILLDKNRSISVISRPIDSTISLTRSVFSGLGHLSPTVADINQDGWPEPLGLLNDGHGNLQRDSHNSVVMGRLLASDRIHRDNRLADLNGDGLLDLITNTYSPFDDSKSIAYLFWGNNNGTFDEDISFSRLKLTGFGETIVIADFDNDGDLDPFISYYTHGKQTGLPLAGGQCYFFINDGSGNLTEVAHQTGLSLAARPVDFRPEGAQAVDFDLDGFIDLYISGHFFFNNGDATFTDRRAEMGLPELFDEGIKFLDWNNDGFLDLIIHHPEQGPNLFAFNGSRFVKIDAFPRAIYRKSYGLNTYDMNNDGLEDVVIAGGILCDPKIFINNGTEFVRSRPKGFCGLCSDLVAFGDFNHDGLIDLVHRTNVGELSVFQNNSARSNSAFVITVVGPCGELNQQGRVIKAWPESSPSTQFTRIVDGGSGFLSQNQYPILIGTPYTGMHHVEVHFADRIVNFSIMPGDNIRVSPLGPEPGVKTSILDSQ